MAGDTQKLQRQLRSQLKSRVGEAGRTELATFLRSIAARSAHEPVLARMHIDTTDINLRLVIARLMCASMKRETLVSDKHGLRSHYDMSETSNLEMPIVAWRGAHGARPSDEQQILQTRITVEDHTPLTLLVTAPELADYEFVMDYWEWCLN